MNLPYEKTDLCVFISTKSRHGRTDDYKVTIENLFLSVPNNFFSQKFVNIKAFKGDEANLNNIINFFKDRNFDISIIQDELNIQDQDRSNNRQKFISAIPKDISTFFVNKKDILNNFIFVLEDDSPVIIKKGKFVDYINKSIYELIKNPAIEAIHFARLSHHDKPVTPTEYLKIFNLLVDEDEIIRHHNYWYSFQPRINRKEDLVNTSIKILENWDNLKYAHPEEVFQIVHTFFGQKLFYAFSPENAYSIHLGATNEEHKEIVESEKFIHDLYINLNINKITS